MAINVRDGDRDPLIMASVVNGSGEHEPVGRSAEVTPGTDADNLGKAEDAAHASGDVGVAVLAVRRDTAAVGSGTDGDYSTINVDSSGKAWVTGTQLEDAAHASGDKGLAALAVRRDTRAVGSGTDGDYSTFNVNAQGDLYVNIAKTIATLAPSALTISNGSAYAAGDAVGGKLTFTGAGRFSGGSLDITGVVLTDIDGQNAEMDLVLFNADPSDSTLTDNAEVVIADADLSKIAAIINLNDYKRLGGATAKSATYFFGISQPFKLASGTTMYGVLITRGTPTYTGTAKLGLRLTAAQD